jgi:hypothetical protein
MEFIRLIHPALGHKEAGVLIPRLSFCGKQQALELGINPCPVFLGVV